MATGPRRSPKKMQSNAAVRTSTGSFPNEQEHGDIPVAKIFVIILAVSALIVGLYIELAKNISGNLKRSDSIHREYPSSIVGCRTTDAATYNTLIVANNLDAGYLDHVIESMINFGHQLSFSGSFTPHKMQSDDLSFYDLIWTHDYPFSSIKRLLPLQRVNHFPGTGFITNKLTLSTTPNVPHLLKAFRLPYERQKFLDYAKEHDHGTDKSLWIQKTSSHRGISIEKSDDVNLDANDTLVQEYMSNPFLIDGKKFDIGIYAVLTSVEPLRVYIYEAEALLRFCADPYVNPETKLFNSSNLDSYVVGDDYTPIWLMPSLVRHYIGSNLSMRKTLDTYLSSVGRDGGTIWGQIERTIKMVYKSKEHHISRLSKMYQEAGGYNRSSARGSMNQFFEMVRFDFIIDDQLNVYLMEANMSPNLSSRHFPPNRLIYEQVLNSYFSLVGLTQFAKQHFLNLPIQYLDQKRENFLEPAEGVKTGTNFGLEKFVGEKELSVYEELCSSNECHMDCAKVDCRICYFCLSENDKLELRRAVFEQRSQWNFKRLLPSTLNEDLEMQLAYPDKNNHIIDSNHIHVQWFRGKCNSDPRYCSY